MSFEVNVDIDDLQPTKSGNFVSWIWVTVDGRAFPNGAWSDFAVRILGWWCDEVAYCVNKASDAAKLRFMDGPYVMGIKCGSDDNCTLFGQVRRLDGNECERIGSAKLAEISQAIADASERVIAKCQAKGWGGPDVEHLATAARKLRLAMDGS